MPDSSSADEYYFLPLCPARAQELLQDECQLHGLGVAELSAVLALHNLPALAHAPGKVETALAKTIRLGLEVNAAHGTQAFARAVTERFCAQQLQAGLELLQDLPLQLLTADEVAAQDYLAADGNWDFSFRRRHGPTLNPLNSTIPTPAGNKAVTEQQFRAFHQLRNELDEHVHFQGLAGVGKTTMIGVLLEYLQPEKTLLLAQTRQQIKQLEDRIGHGKFRALTFGQLASRLLYAAGSQYPAPARQRYSQSYHVSDAATARLLHIRPVANMPAARVAEICRRTVASYCYSASSEITSANIPQLDVRLSLADQAMLLEYARSFWQETIFPSRNVEGQLAGLPIRTYHQIKLLSLDSNIRLDEHRFNHIIIDEAHDLAAPLLQFLDRCPQAICTLGDSCQQLDGIPNQRSAAVRRKELFQSVRSGKQMESVLNPLIESLPDSRLNGMLGARDKKTVIRYYDRAAIPEDGTTILVRGEWGLFEWFQRLAAANASFAMLDSSMASFRSFVHSCIELFHHGSAPSHGLIFRHDSWSSLAQAHANNPSFRRIESMLERGYSAMDFERSLDKLSPPEQAKILLGRVADARSAELDKVMLGSDLLDATRSKNADEIRRSIALLYTGSSRARHQLYLPGHWQDWLTDLCR